MRRAPQAKESPYRPVLTSKEPFSGLGHGQFKRPAVRTGVRALRKSGSLTRLKIVVAAFNSLYLFSNDSLYQPNVLDLDILHIHSFSFHKTVDVTFSN